MAQGGHDPQRCSLEIPKDLAKRLKVDREHAIIDLARNVLRCNSPNKIIAIIDDYYCVLSHDEHLILKKSPVTIMFPSGFSVIFVKQGKHCFFVVSRFFSS